MSFKRNVLVTYASQIYITFVGIVMLPLYLRYMGVEAYGLVGFFTMLQVWFNLLDMGLTPTVAREAARFFGGAIDAVSYRRFVRALQAIFLAIALAGGGAIFASASFISSDWLKVQSLPLSEVQFALEVMAVGIAMRWMAGLYRGIVSGSERLVWLGGFNTIIATLRFVGIYPVLMFVGTTPTIFFTYQLIVAVAELTLLAAKTYKLLPSIPAGERLGWSFAPIAPVLKFSLTIAFTSSVWTMVTQIDKLVLSKLLPLADYAYFTLAVLAASGVMIASGPISTALTPRLARMQAEGEDDGLLKLYRDATQAICVIAVPVSVTLAIFAEPILWAWTGDIIAAKNAAPIMQLYAIGNGVLAVAAFPYYLQYAKGDLRLHLLGNGIFVVMLIPSLVWATWKFGGVGAGWSWLGSNLVYFFVWIPIVHRQFLAGQHINWVKHDVMPFVVVAGAAAFLLSNLMPAARDGRLQVVLVVMIVGLLTTALTSLASKTIRSNVYRWYRSNVRG